MYQSESMASILGPTVLVCPPRAKSDRNRSVYEGYGLFPRRTQTNSTSQKKVKIFVGNAPERNITPNQLRPLHPYRPPIRRSGALFGA